jgi:acyl carrier protein
MMNEVSLSEKLTRCFRAVFPRLPEAAIPAASVATVVAWDSLAAITLLHVVEEEFQVEVDMEKLAELDSFEKWAAFLSTETGQA